MRGFIRQVTWVDISTQEKKKSLISFGLAISSTLRANAPIVFPKRCQIFLFILLNVIFYFFFFVCRD